MTFDTLRIKGNFITCSLR